MKIDIDTIFYIVISILILLITGLSRRKKKAAAPTTGLQNMQNQDREAPRNELKNDMEMSVHDPFVRLEKLFLQPEPVSTPEAVSLEELVDEETEYLKEKENASQTSPVEQQIHTKDLNQESIQLLDKDIQDLKLDLFPDADELKKAIIYAEILKRKEY